MKAILLCAGFGTRLYPLTERQAKALLPIAGEPLLNHLMKKLVPMKDLTEIVLISNGRFYNDFSDWKKTFAMPCPITIINDRTMDNDHRLGAIRDLKLGIDEGKVNDDILVLAGDNLFDLDLTGFVKFAKSKKPGISVGAYQLADRELAKKYGLIKTDSSDKIMQFFEKPKDPPTLLASMGVYYFPKESLQWINRFLEENKNMDAPGYYLAWLLSRVDLFAYPFKEGLWFDVGDLNSYQKADQHFKEFLGR